MPLSEHEQRLLEQMERAFYEEDPQFATAMQQPRTPFGRRAALAIVLAVAGLGVIIAGLASRIPLLGVAGFAALLLAVSMMLPSGKATAAAGERPTVPRHGSTGRRSFSQRLDERWDRRREQ